MNKKVTGKQVGDISFWTAFIAGFIITVIFQWFVCAR